MNAIAVAIVILFISAADDAYVIRNEKRPERRLSVACKVMLRKYSGGRIPG
jgi:hypothetical protein